MTCPYVSKISFPIQKPQTAVRAGRLVSTCLLFGMASYFAFVATVPAAVILQDSFGGLDTALRQDAAGNPVLIDSNRPELAGIRAETPGNAAAVWTAPGGQKVKTWAFSFSTPDPFEPPSPLETPPVNGSATWQDTVNTGGDALLPFSPPATAYQVSLDAVSGSSGIAIGFSSSEVVLTNNFASFGEVWLSLDGGFQGDTVPWTLHTHGTTGPTVSGTTKLQGYNPLVLAYDPVNHTVRGTVNGQDTPVLSYTAVGIHAVAFEGSGTVDSFIVQTAAPVIPKPVILPLTFVGADQVVVTWSAVSGFTYRVQYKTDLSTAVWNDLVGDVTATGSTATKTDIRTLTQRFYQVQLLP